MSGFTSLATSPQGARLWLVCVSSVVFALQLTTYVAYNLNQTFRGLNAGEVRVVTQWIPDHILVADLGAAERKRDSSIDHRVPLPETWMKGAPGDRRSPPSLLIYLDGAFVHYAFGDPETPAERSYAYFKTPRSPVLVLRCAPTSACREAIVVRDDFVFSLALLRYRVQRSPEHLWLTLLALGLWIAVAVGARASFPALHPAVSTLLAAAVGGAWIGFDLYATSWSVPILIVESLALGGSAIQSFRRALAERLRRLWEEATSPQETSCARAARLLFLTAVPCLVAVPYVLTGLSWYPDDRDDSFIYLRAASRVMSGQDPTSQIYSAFPLGLAAVSAAAGVHPMVAYRWLGYAGAALLPAAMGAFAYLVTKRLRTALLACWIGGLWGGLAGYLWLFSQALPALMRLDLPPLLTDDYFDPRFLGEYTGPHSEITAYLCRVPFYPREAGLVLFWPALGLVYASGLQPGLRRLGLFTLLAILCTAVYPLYGIPGLIVVALVGLLEGRRYLRLRQWGRLAMMLALSAAGAAAVIAVADFLVRHYKWPAGLIPYLRDLLNRPVGTLPWFPSLQFSIPRILSGHAFMIAAAWLASRLAPEAWGLLRNWRGAPLFVTSLCLSVFAGLSIAWTRVGHALLDPYGWIVPWRTLVEPVLVLGAAASLDLILGRFQGRGRGLVTLALLLVPTFSALHWTINADLYLRSIAGDSWGRGKNYKLWQETEEQAGPLLGRVRLREPVLAEAGPVLYLEAALGVSTVPLGAPAGAFLAPESQGPLLSRLAAGEIGEVAALTGRPLMERLLETNRLRPVAVVGPYTVFRLVGPAAGEVVWTMINVNGGVQQADAHLLQFPDGTLILVDAGHHGGGVAAYLNGQGIRRIHKVLISHPHKDHYGGLEDILDQGIRIDDLYMNEPASEICDPERPWGCDLPHVRATFERFKRQGVPVRSIRAGDVFYRRGEVSLEALYAFNGLDAPVGRTDINDMSVILLLTNGRTHALFTGDLNGPLGAYLAKKGERLEADILKVPHHGAEGVAPNEFFDRVAPRVALVPAPEHLWLSERDRRVREHLAARKVQVWVSGLHGHVTVRIRRDGYDVRAEKPAPPF